MKRPEYQDLIATGMAPKLAEMLATGKTPAANTDDGFLKGQKNGEQFAHDPKQGNRYAKRLRQAGGSPAGKRYFPGLARFPGDPQAWVSSRGEFAAVIRKRGWECEGAVTVKANADCRDPGPQAAVADDILESRVQSVGMMEPEKVSTPQKRAKLKAEIKERIKPHWAKD